MSHKPAIFIALFISAALLNACSLLPTPSSRPSVIISAPPSGSAYTVGEAVVVQSTNTDPARIVRVELIVDGMTVRQDSSPVATGQEQFSLLQSWTADRVGQRNLIVRATNAQGVTSESGIYVTVQESALTAPATLTAAPAIAIPTLTDLPTATPPPTQTTNPAITVIVTATSEPTQAPTNTPTQTTTANSEAASCTDNAAFVTDVTIPDGTNFSPNATFTKTWRVRNTGTCNWQNYNLAFVNGAQLNGAASVTVPATAAGATADISVPLTAPATFGSYTGAWRLRNATSALFGTSVTVKINVSSQNAATNATTAAGNATPANTTVPPTLPAAASCSGQPANFTFTASKASVTAGQSVTLNWGAISNASIAVLNGGQFSNQGVGAPGSITASPNATTTYTLTATCSNGGGTRTNSVTVNVSGNPPPAACSGTPATGVFTASAASIQSGQSVTINWGPPTNADQLSLESSLVAEQLVPLSGSRTDTLTSNTQYKLTAKCTANGKFVHTFLTVTVTGGGGACSGNPSISSFTASATTIQAGQSVTLSWGPVTNADSVVFDNPAPTGGGEVTAPGALTLSPTTTTTYYLVAACRPTGNIATKTLTVTVTPAGVGCSGKPTIATFNASATTITKGQVVTLSWDGITNYDEVRFYSGGTDFETVGPTAQRNRIPNQTTTYELTALCNASGTSTTRQITVTVNP